MDCNFCYKRNAKERIPKEFLLNSPQYLNQITEQVALGGGEPTLRIEEVNRFAKKCQDFDLKVNMTTNGKKLGDIKKYKYFDMVSVSFDKEKIKSKDDFQAYLDTCDKLSKVTSVGSNFLIDKNMFNKYKSLEALVGEISKHVDRVFLLSPKLIELPHIKEQKLHYLETVNNLDSIYVDDLTKRILEDGYNSWDKPCHYGRDIASINQDLSVTGCSFSKDSKLQLKKPKDILKIKDTKFKKRFKCPYMVRE